MTKQNTTIQQQRRICSSSSQCYYNENNSMDACSQTAIPCATPAAFYFDEEEKTIPEFQLPLKKVDSIGIFLNQEDTPIKNDLTYFFDFDSAVKPSNDRCSIFGDQSFSEPQQQMDIESETSNATRFLLNFDNELESDNQYSYNQNDIMDLLEYSNERQNKIQKVEDNLSTISSSSKKIKKKMKKFTKEQRQEVKDAYLKYLEDQIALGKPEQEAEKVAKHLLKDDTRFSNISRQLKNHWIKRKHFKDNRKHNKGYKGKRFEKFNKDLASEFPQRLFAYTGKSLFKSTIYNQIVIDFYKDNQAKYAEQIKPQQIFTKTGKRSILTKCWFEGFSRKYNFNFDSVQTQKVNKQVYITEFDFNGQTYKRY